MPRLVNMHFDLSIEAKHFKNFSENNKMKLTNRIISTYNRKVMEIIMQ